MLKFVKLISEKSLGKGWVRVVLHTSEVVSNLMQCSFEQRGHRESFLGENGWQVASHFFEINLDCNSTDQECSFLVEPKISRHMNLGSNYQLTIMSESGVPLGTCALSWRGVPQYAEFKSSINSIGVTSPISVVTNTKPVLQPAEMTWTVNPEEFEETVAIPDLEQSLTPDLEHSATSTSLDIARLAVKVTCPHGDHKILSTMVFCPICSKPVK